MTPTFLGGKEIEGFQEKEINQEKNNEERKGYSDDAAATTNMTTTMLMTTWPKRRVIGKLGREKQDLEEKIPSRENREVERKLEELSDIPRIRAAGNG